MSMLDSILEQAGLKYEDLDKAEEATLHKWLGSLERKEFTVNSIREYIVAMRRSVDEEVSKTGHNSKQDIFLKARLRNYILLEAFLDSPAKAKKMVERRLAGLVSKK